MYQCLHLFRGLSGRCSTSWSLRVSDRVRSRSSESWSLRGSYSLAPPMSKFRVSGFRFLGPQITDCRSPLSTNEVEVEVFPPPPTSPHPLSLSLSGARQKNNVDPGVPSRRKVTECTGFVGVSVGVFLVGWSVGPQEIRLV